MKKLRSLLCFLLCLAVLAPLGGAALAADPAPFLLAVRVADGGEREVRAYEESYPGNIYLSLADLSQAMSGSQGQFRFEYAGTDNYFSVMTGKSPAAPLDRGAAGARGSVVYLDYTRSRLYCNGVERRYYTYREGNRDLYMSLTDVQLLLDMTASWDENGVLVLDPYVPFAPELKDLQEAGYFEAIGAIVLGDADTGEILYYKDGRRALPIASLSKLMTYLLLCEAAERGEISFSSGVLITEESDRIARSADGMISMTAGTTVPFTELLQGMLLASSNEAAASLAAYAAGTSEAFVEQMNSRAHELGWASARFYTPHGLPLYAGGAIPAKRQNEMSAMDLFKLCAYLLKNESRITDITSLQYANLPTLKYSTFNTNTLVYNVPGVTGLKTGSTDRAGKCVAVSLPITRDGETHNIVLVLLGAESTALRDQAGEILLRWAQDHYAAADFRRAA
ncbi:MAG: serine hydrolase [Eubacteriales bacterium]|nr:D-alanyl-D-alanine carboxypeptidase [Oscillospiraceae bacterium]MDO4862240.1 serine hydrolase [Eubacteriales bacterium]